MNHRTLVPIVVALAVSGCQATSVSTSQNDRVNAVAYACVSELNARKEAHKSNGSIAWNTSVEPGHLESVDLPYVELGSEGTNKGAAWRACMNSHGVNVDSLNLGERNLEPAYLSDIR